MIFFNLVVKSRFLCVATLFCIAGYGHAATHNYIVSPQGGDITGAQLSAKLQIGSVTLESGKGHTYGLGNIIINDAVTWTSNSTLTLKASNNVIVQAVITASGETSGVVISSNVPNNSEPASGTGTHYIHTGGAISLSGQTPSLTIDGNSYTIINALGSPTDATTPPNTPSLQGMAAPTNNAQYFALGSDIDASATSSWNKGVGFTPIAGGQATPPAAFNGIFNGLGHRIKNLAINTPPKYPITTNSNVGLFGTVGGKGQIRNIGLVGGSVTGAMYVGGLAGLNHGLIENSYSTNSVTGAAYDVGGLVGQNMGVIKSSYATGPVIANLPQYGLEVGGLVGENLGGRIYNSYATGNVTGLVEVGGLAGSNSGAIVGSYATGSVNGTNQVGGLVGYANSKVLRGQTSISSSYATGSVSGKTNVGGLVGLIDAPKNSGGATITTSYAAGPVSGEKSVGGLVGNSVTAQVVNSYWDMTISGQSTSSGGGLGMSTTDMMTASQFLGFTFTSSYSAGYDWVIVDTDGSLNNDNGFLGATYPQLARNYFKRPWNQ